MQLEPAQGMSVEEARELFEKLDVSGDGTISADEFAQFKLKMQAGDFDV